MYYAIFCSTLNKDFKHLIIIRNVVYRENVQSICHACSAYDETVAHMVSEYSTQAPKEHK